MAKTVYKNVGITVTLDVGIGQTAWIMQNNSPGQYKIEDVEICITQDKKIFAKYILRISEEETIEKKSNEIFKTKQALLKSL